MDYGIRPSSSSYSKKWQQGKNELPPRKEDQVFSLIQPEQVFTSLENLFKKMEMLLEEHQPLLFSNDTVELLQITHKILKLRLSSNPEMDGASPASSEESNKSDMDSLRDLMKKLEVELLEGNGLFPLCSELGDHNDFITIIHVLVYAKEILLNTRLNKQLMKNIIFSIWILILNDEITKKNSIVLFSSNMLYNIIYVLMISYLSPKSPAAFSEDLPLENEYFLRELEGLNPKFFNKHLKPYLKNKRNKIMETIFIELSKQIIKKFFLIQSYAQVFMETLFKLSVHLMSVSDPSECCEQHIEGNSEDGGPTKIIDLKFLNFVLKTFLTIINTQTKNVEAFKSLMKCEITFKNITPLEALFRCFAFNLIKDITGKEIEISSLKPFIKITGMQDFNKNTNVIVERDAIIMKNENNKFIKLLLKLLSLLTNLILKITDSVEKNIFEVIMTSINNILSLFFQKSLLDPGLFDTIFDENNNQFPEFIKTTFFSISNLEVTQPILDSIVRMILGERFRPRVMRTARHFWSFSKDYCQIVEANILKFLKVLVKWILLEDHLNVISITTDQNNATQDGTTFISVLEVINTFSDYIWRLNEDLILENIELVLKYFEYEGKVVNCLSQKELENRRLLSVFVVRNEQIYKKPRILYQLLLKENFLDVLLFKCFQIKNKEIALNFLNQVYQGILVEGDFSSLFRNLFSKFLTKYIQFLSVFKNENKEASLDLIFGEQNLSTVEFEEQKIVFLLIFAQKLILFQNVFDFAYVFDKIDLTALKTVENLYVEKKNEEFAIFFMSFNLYQELMEIFKNPQFQKINLLFEFLRLTFVTIESDFTLQSYFQKNVYHIQLLSIIYDTNKSQRIEGKNCLYLLNFIMNLATCGDFYHTVESQLLRESQSFQKNSGNSSFQDMPSEPQGEESSFIADVCETYFGSCSELVSNLRIRMPFFIDILLRLLYELQLSFNLKHLYLSILLDLVKSSTFNSSQLGSVEFVERLLFLLRIEEDEKLRQIIFSLISASASNYLNLSQFKALLNTIKFNISPEVIYRCFEESPLQTMIDGIMEKLYNPENYFTSLKNVFSLLLKILQNKNSNNMVLDFNGKNSALIIENLESFTPFNFTLVLEIQFNSLGGKKAENKEIRLNSIPNIKNSSLQNLSLSSSRTENKEKIINLQELKFRSENRNPNTNLNEEKSLSIDEDIYSANIISLVTPNGAQFDIYIDSFKKNSLVIDLFVPKRNAHLREVFEYEFHEKTVYHLMITSCKDKERENKGTILVFIDGNQIQGQNKTIFGNSLKELEKLKYLVLGASMLPLENKEVKKASPHNAMLDSVQLRESGFENLGHFFNGEIKNFYLLKGTFKPPKGGLENNKRFYEGDIFICKNLFSWMTLLDGSAGWQKFSQVAQVQRARNSRKGIKNNENELILNDGKIFLIPTNAAEMPITSRNDYISMKILKNIFGFKNIISEKEEERLINMKTGRNFEIYSRGATLVERESLVNIILTLGNIDMFLYIIDMIRNMSILTNEESNLLFIEAISIIQALLELNNYEIMVFFKKYGVWILSYLLNTVKGSKIGTLDRLMVFVRNMRDVQIRYESFICLILNFEPYSSSSFEVQERLLNNLHSLLADDSKLLEKFRSKIQIEYFFYGLEIYFNIDINLKGVGDKPGIHGEKNPLTITQIKNLRSRILALIYKVTHLVIKLLKENDSREILEKELRIFLNYISISDIGPNLMDYLNMMKSLLLDEESEKYRYILKSLDLKTFLKGFLANMRRNKSDLDFLIYKNFKQEELRGLFDEDEFYSVFIEIFRYFILPTPGAPLDINNITKHTIDIRENRSFIALLSGVVPVKFGPQTFSTIIMLLNDSIKFDYYLEHSITELIFQRFFFVSDQQKYDILREINNIVLNREEKYLKEFAYFHGLNYFMNNTLALEIPEEVTLAQNIRRTIEEIAVQVINFHLDNNERGVEMIRNFIVYDQDSNMTRNFEIVIKLLATKFHEIVQYTISSLELPTKRNLLFISNLFLLVYMLEDMVYENSALVKVNPKCLTDALGWMINILSRLKLLYVTQPFITSPIISFNAKSLWERLVEFTHPGIFPLKNGGILRAVLSILFKIMHVLKMDEGVKAFCLIHNILIPDTEDKLNPKKRTLNRNDPNSAANNKKALDDCITESNDLFLRIYKPVIPGSVSLIVYDYDGPDLFTSCIYEYAFMEVWSYIFLELQLLKDKKKRRSESETRNIYKAKPENSENILKWFEDKLSQSGEENFQDFEKNNPVLFEAILVFKEITTVVGHDIIQRLNISNKNVYYDLRDSHRFIRHWKNNKPLNRCKETFCNVIEKFNMEILRDLDNMERTVAGGAKDSEKERVMKFKSFSISNEPCYRGLHDLIYDCIKIESKVNNVKKIIATITKYKSEFVERSLPVIYFECLKNIKFIEMVSSYAYSNKVSFILERLKSQKVDNGFIYTKERYEKSRIRVKHLNQTNYKKFKAFKKQSKKKIEEYVQKEGVNMMKVLKKWQFHKRCLIDQRGLWNEEKAEIKSNIFKLSNIEDSLRRRFLLKPDKKSDPTKYLSIDTYKERFSIRSSQNRRIESSCSSPPGKNLNQSSLTEDVDTPKGQFNKMHQKNSQNADDSDYNIDRAKMRKSLSNFASEERCSDSEQMEEEPKKSKSSFISLILKPNTLQYPTFLMFANKGVFPVHPNSKMRNIEEVFRNENEDFIKASIFDIEGKEKQVIFKAECELVNCKQAVYGNLEVTRSHLIFQSFKQERPQGIKYIYGSQKYMIKKVTKKKQWLLKDINQVHSRSCFFVENSFEIFLRTGKVYFINLYDTETQTNFLKKISELLGRVRDSVLVFKRRTDNFSKYGFTNMWLNNEISNFEYLMLINTFAGRTYNDLGQYPIFPWILQDYTSNNINLKDPKFYRDLRKPIGALNEERLQIFQERLSFSDTNEIPKFLYGSHYSSSAIVLYYLLRLEPYTSLNLELQSGKFDYPDRLFSSVQSAWNSSLYNTSDVKELIPEFFYLSEFLKNKNKINFGCKQQTLEKVDCVKLPNWASTPEEFIAINREALESDYVSENLHNWIDLIFGFKQKDEEALKNNNLFYYLTYERKVDIGSIRDERMREATLSQINYYGQTPYQLFQQPHPAKIKKLSLYQPWNSMDQINLSYHTRIEGSIIFVSGLNKKIKLLTNTCIIYEMSTQLRSLQIQNQKPLGKIILNEFNNSSQFYHFSKNNWWIVGGYSDSSFKFVKDQKLIQSINFHKKMITCVAVCEKQNIVICASKDCRITVWNINEKGFILPEPRMIVYCHHCEITEIRYNSCLGILASSDKEGMIHIHSIVTGNPVRTIANKIDKKADEVIWSLRINEMGMIMATTTKNRVLIHNLNGECLLDEVPRLESGSQITQINFLRENSLDIIISTSKGNLFILGSMNFQEPLKIKYDFHLPEIIQKEKIIKKSLAIKQHEGLNCFYIDLKQGTLLCGYETGNFAFFNFAKY